MILNTYATQFDDCTKDVLKELHVQEEEMSDSDEESAEVEDKQIVDNYHVPVAKNVIKAIIEVYKFRMFNFRVS